MSGAESGSLWDTKLTEEQERAAGLTVCDPARGLSKEEANEVLTALGLKEDPNHTELTDLGRKKHN